MESRSESHSESEDEQWEDNDSIRSSTSTANDDSSSSDDETPTRPIFDLIFHHLNIRYENVLKDYEEDQVVLVDGDCLLLEAFTDRTLDWDHGGQYLHLTYLVEKTLNGFRRKNARIHVVFFRLMESAWSSSTGGDLSCLLARKAVIRHLKQSTHLSIVDRFESFLSEDWEEFVRRDPPCFVVTSDKPFGDVTRDRCRFLLENFKLPLSAFLVGCQRMEVDCVFLAGLQFKVNQTYAFRCCFSPSMKKEIEEVRQTLTEPALTHLRSLHSQHQQAESPAAFEKFFSANIERFVESVGNDFRSILFGIASAYILHTAPEQISLVQLFILHAGLIDLLPLRDRCQVLRRGFDQSSDIRKETAQFLEKMIELICQGEGHVTALNMDFPKSRKQFADLMDGRLFCQLVWRFITSPVLISDAISRVFQGSDLALTSKRLLALWDVVCAVSSSPGFDLPLWPLVSSSKNDCTGILMSGPKHSISPRSEFLLHEISFMSYDIYVGEMKRTLNYGRDDCFTQSDVSPIAQDDSSEETKGLYCPEFHWHSGKVIEGGMGALPTFLKKTTYSQDQTKYKRFLQDYSTSLVGGAILNADPLLYRDQSKQSVKPVKQSAKIRKIIAENEERKKKEKVDRELEKFDTLFGRWSSSSAKGQLSELDAFIKKTHPDVQFKARERKFDLCRRELESCLSSNEQRIFWKVRLLMAIHSLVDEHCLIIDKKLRRSIVKEIKQLGFPSNAAMIKKELADKKSVLKESNDEVSADEGYFRFQFLNMGHLMQSEAKLLPDPRVKEFIPDNWQREVMDVVDKNESVIVSAPTSSGKTFISFYCMEKVLRSGPDGILVYVSPTKALVNQVAATIYAQFAHRKTDLPQGRTLCGVFTRDYRWQPYNCQILVTVPEVFDIFLLSTSSQKWVRNLKYVIFDEIHCLSQEGRGKVWERLLLLVPCPFLALSATIGNPEGFQRWIQIVQRAKRGVSPRVRLVIHKASDRYSYLQKHIAVPEKSKSFSTDLIPIHPASGVAFGRIVQFGFPEDYTMSTAESLRLYDELRKLFPDNPSLAANDPELFFRGERIVRRSGAKKFEEKLKLFVEEMSKLSPEREKIQELLHSLHPSSEQRKAAEENCSFQVLDDNISKLLLKLNEEDKLPVIVFCLDRVGCEILVETIVDYLSFMEEMSEPAGARSFKAENRRRKEEKKKRKREEKQNRLLRGKKKREERDEPDESASSSAPDALDEYDPRRCKKEFSFFNWTKAFTSRDFADLQRRYLRYSRNTWFKEAIQRGVGCHHGGMATKERQLTEKLFREGAIKVVVATSTLALGVHMPCRTVVFAGDSPFLDSLGFRQMSGRAGRRGFDSIGNVVFFGVPWKKICQLMTTGVPSLRSSGTLDFSTILRLVTFEMLSPFSEEDQQKGLSFLRNAMAVHETPELKMLQKHFYVLAIEYLRTKSFLSPLGEPIHLAGLVIHLNYVDPQNFLAVSFLEMGLFSDIIEADGHNEKLSDATLRRLVHVLAYLFGRQPVHASAKECHDRHNHGKKGSPCEIILPPPDDDVQDFIERHNDEVIEIATRYIASVAPSEEGKAELSLSKIEFSVDSKEVNSEWNRLLSHFRSDTEHCQIRLPFYSLSGDRGKCRADNLHYVREFFGVMSDNLPLLETVPAVPYSSYVLDFFKNEQAIALEEWSGLTSGDLFRGLQDFYYCTRAMSVALGKLEGHECSKLFPAFDQLATAFGSKFSKAYKFQL